MKNSDYMLGGELAAVLAQKIKDTGDTVDLQPITAFVLSTENKLLITGFMSSLGELASKGVATS